MSAKEIVQVIGELVAEEGVALGRRHGPQALDRAQEIEAALVPRLEADPVYGSLWQRFRNDPEGMAAALAGVVQVLLVADAALAQRLEDLLAAFREASTAQQAGTVASGDRSVAIGRDARGSTITTGDIRTGGGAYVGGDVTVEGGDFVGRDKITTTYQGERLAEVNALFDKLYAVVQARPETPPEERDDLQAEIEEVQQALTAEEAVDEGFLARRLRNIGRMAPDILEVVLDTLANPVIGLRTVVRKIRERAKEESGGS